LLRSSIDRFVPQNPLERYLRAGKRIRQGRAVAPGQHVHPQVEPDLGRRVAHPVGQGGVLDVDDEHPAATRIAQQPGDGRADRLIHRQVDAQVAECARGVDEIPLHINDQQRGVRRCDELVQLGVDRLTRNLDHALSRS
jgi:hypothetical protein